MGKFDDCKRERFAEARYRELLAPQDPGRPLDHRNGLVVTEIDWTKHYIPLEDPTLRVVVYTTEDLNMKDHSPMYCMGPRGRQSEDLRDCVQEYDTVTQGIDPTQLVTYKKSKSCDKNEEVYCVWARLRITVMDGMRAEIQFDVNGDPDFNPGRIHPHKLHLPRANHYEQIMTIAVVPIS